MSQAYLQATMKEQEISLLKDTAFMVEMEQGAFLVSRWLPGILRK